MLIIRGRYSSISHPLEETEHQTQRTTLSTQDIGMRSTTPYQPSFSMTRSTSTFPNLLLHRTATNSPSNNKHIVSNVAMIHPFGDLSIVLRNHISGTSGGIKNIITFADKKIHLMNLRTFLSTSLFLIFLLASCNEKEEKQHALPAPMEEIDTTSMKKSLLREIKNYVNQYDSCNAFLLYPTFFYKLDNDQDYYDDFKYNEIFCIGKIFFQHHLNTK